MKTISHSVAAKPTRVLMTADAVGGVWSYAMELVQGLSRLGMKVALAVMGGRPSRAARADVRRIPGVELHESTYKLEWMRDPWSDVDAAGRWLLQLAQHVQPDLVHLNNFAHGGLPFGAPALVVGHSCVLSWWEAVRHEPAPAEWDEYRRRVKEGLAAADQVVAPTQHMLDTLAEHYGPLSRTCVIPNGRSLGLCGPGQKEPFIFAAGRLWDAAKNIAALDAIARKLDWPVYVAGDAEGPDGERLQPKDLQILGRLHPRTMATWYARAGIYALPARYEPFGLTVLEAALSGCALVLGDIPSLRELWGDAALFVPPEDGDALEHTLARLIAHERERRDLGARALAKAQMFAGCRMLAGYTKTYRELLQTHRRGAAVRRYSPARQPAAAPTVQS